MRISKKAVGYVTLGLVLLLALFFLALPPLVKHIAVTRIDEATGRKSRIQKISLNPFNLTAGISGFSLSEKGSQAPFITFSSARLSLSPLSLPKRSFIVDEIHLASPYVHLVRNAPNRYNFSDLVTPKKEGGQKKEGTPLFSLNNIIVKNGTVGFEDRGIQPEKQHRVTGMSLAIPFVSNMPYLADRYVTPHFSAEINGSPFRFDGKLKPLTKAVEATVSLNLKKVNLPFYLGYVPVPLPVDVKAGRLATALELGYRVDEKTGPELRLAGDVGVDDLKVSEPKGAPVAGVGEARLSIADSRLISGTYDLRSLELQNVELWAARDRSGIWNLQRLAKGGKKPTTDIEQKPAKPHEKKPLQLKLAKLALKDGKVHLSDQVPSGGFRTDLNDFDVSMQNFSLAQGQKAPCELKFRSSKGERFAFKGELAATPVALQGKLDLNGVPLKEYYPYLRETLTSPIDGKLGLTSGIVYNDQAGLLLEKATLTAEGLAASFGQGEGFRVKSTEIKGATLDLKRNHAEVEKVGVTSGTFTLSSDKAGELSARRLLWTKATAPKTRTPSPEKKQKPKAKPAPLFSYRIHRVAASGLAVNFTDRSKEDAPLFQLSRINLTADGVTGPKQGPIPFKLAAAYGKKGGIRAAGNFTPTPLKFKGHVELDAIPLRDFDAYMPEDTSVFIAEGALDTKMALNIEKAASGMKGSFDGSLGIRSFYCQDAELDEDLLKWERLQLDRVTGTVAPFTLAINNVSLSNFYSRVIVEKDGTLNLQHLTGEEEQSKPAPAAQGAQQATAKPGGAPQPASAAGTQESPAQPHPIRIDAVTVQGGTLAFSDRHLESPFDTTFYNLGGRVSGLSSQATKLADVDLRGNLENHSPLSIRGVINPLRGDLYLDLVIAFKDIELSPLTPYSNTYLGYEIDKGKLSLDLSYKIDKKALSSQNKVFIDQFTFGKQVDNPKATKLPVRLAVALLKDRNGEIHLDLPVAGKTDDPKFSVWKVVLQMLKNLLVKAATSPFALLSSAFGSGQDFSAVIFEPGSERIAKPEQEKLLKLSQALRERPDLKVEITGYVDRERDAEGYRNEILMKKMKGEKFRRMVKEGKTREGQTQQEIEILPQEYSRYLKDVYSKEKFPKPRNALGFQKDIPDQEMKKLILSHTVVGQNELQTLAHERAEAVKAFLMTQGKLPAERLYLKSADIHKAPAKEGVPASRVEFGAGV
jgi:uncharacterized protein involved in outer membrane biogenesis/outer membrane protein OmpA-like peptidoglycan-associated protein